MDDFRVIASGLNFPEGPVAAGNGDFFVVETAGGCLTHLRADGAVVARIVLGGGPNGIAVGPDGALYVANNGGFAWREVEGVLFPVGLPADYAGGRIERVDPATGAARVLYQSCGARQLRGPNDLVFDRHGGFYFTDTGKLRDTGVDYGGVYYALPHGGHIHEVAFPMSLPNGIALSPDGAMLYVAETETARIWQFDVTAPGVVARRSMPMHGGRILIGLGGFQMLDSMAVTASGNICVGTLGTGAISVVSPAGELLRQVTVPDVHPTNICFGGADRRTAYVTLAASGRLAALAWPEPGLELAFGL
jgi:gluconolactonase